MSTSATMTPHRARPIPGLLHVYDVENRLTFFESGLTNSENTTGWFSSSLSASKLSAVPNSLIFVGGLGDGLSAIPVLPDLSQALHDLGDWSLIQVLTRSSYLGWVNGDVDRDVADLRTLETYLRKEAGKTGKLVLLGHSTGCQDIVRLLQLHHTETSYDAVILQAPVSDREFTAFAMPAEDLEKTIASAREQVKAGGGSYPLPWELLKLITDYKEYKDPISAERWLSLVAEGGREDYFSSDLSDEKLREIFTGPRSRGKPLLFLLGEKDECYPDGVDKQKLLDRFLKAMQGSASPASGQVLVNATHSIEDTEVQKHLIGEVLTFVKSL